MGLLSTKIIGNVAQRESTSDIRHQSLAPYLLPTPFSHFCELNYPIGIHKASGTSLSAYICQHVNYGSGVNSISNVMGGLMLVFFILPNRNSPVLRFYLNLPSCCCTCPSSGHADKADNYKLRSNAQQSHHSTMCSKYRSRKRKRYKTTFFRNGTPSQCNVV